MYTREIDFFLNSFQQFLPFTFESALSTKVSNCWRTLASHSNPSLRSTCTSTSWCAWTPRGKKEGKRICVQQPPDLAVSRNSSAINDNRFKYQFSACIELRGECTPRGYGIPSIFRSSSFWGGIYQRCQASGQKGFVDKKDARAKLEIRCFWLRCGRKSIGWMMDLIGFDIWNFSTNLESVHLERKCWRFFLLDRTIRGEVVKNFPLRFLWNSLFYQEKESTLQRRRFQVLSLSSYFILVSIFLFVPKLFHISSISPLEIIFDKRRITTAS